MKKLECILVKVILILSTLIFLFGCYNIVVSECRLYKIKKEIRIKQEIRKNVLDKINSSDYVPTELIPVDTVKWGVNRDVL